MISFKKKRSFFYLIQMATSVSASYSAGDTSQQRLRRPTHSQQSILPLRRERTTMDGALNRSRESKSVCSHESPVRSSAFSGGINISLIFW